MNLKIVDTANRICIIISRKDINISLRTMAIFLLGRKHNMTKYAKNLDHPRIIKEIKEKIREIETKITKKVKEQ